MTWELLAAVTRNRDAVPGLVLPPRPSICRQAPAAAAQALEPRGCAGDRQRARRVRQKLAWDCGTREFKNSCASFGYGRSVRLGNPEGDRLFFLNSDSILHRNRKPIRHWKGPRLAAVRMSRPCRIRRIELQLQRRITRQARAPSRPVVVYASCDFVTPRVGFLRFQKFRLKRRGRCGRVLSRLHDHDTLLGGAKQRAVLLRGSRIVGTSDWEEFSCAASNTNREGTEFSSTLAAKRCSLASYASGSINRTEGGSFKLDSTSGSNLDFMSDDLKLADFRPQPWTAPRSSQRMDRCSDTKQQTQNEARAFKLVEDNGMSTLPLGPAAC